MNKHNLIQQISTPTTKNKLIDHIWSNIPRMNTKYRATNAYWPNYHKPIYCAFNSQRSMGILVQNHSKLPPYEKMTYNYFLIGIFLYLTVQ
jgi:hypothetical protein